MASTNTLEQIAELGDRLAPLGRKSRGMAIEADEWNALVEVLQGVLEVDRAQQRAVTGTLEEQFAKREHEHLGRVTAAWLDSELQARLADGGGGSVNTRASIAEVSQKVSALSAEVARLSAVVDELRKSSDRAASEELDRTRKLNGFEQRFGTVEDLRSLVGGLGGQIAGLTKNVDVVLGLRESLTNADGTPIDVSGLRRDVQGLEALRENLKGVDGGLIRMRDVELKLQELEEATGGNALDERLAGFSVELEQKLDSRVMSAAGTLRADFEGSFSRSADALRGELQAQLAETKAGLDQSLSERFELGEARLDSALSAGIRSGLDVVVDTVSESATRAVDERLSLLATDLERTVTERTREAVSSLRGELRADLRTAVSDELRAALPAALAPLESRTAELDRRVTEEAAALPDRLANSVESAAEALQARLDARLDTGVAAVRVSIEAGIASRVASEVDGRLSTLDARVDASVDRKLGNLDSRVSASVGLALSGLPDEIRREVQTELAALDVSGQIGRASGVLTQQWRSELATTSADLRALVSGNVRDAMASVQLQIASVRREAVEESLGRTVRLIGESEERLGKSIDQVAIDLRRRVVPVPIG